MSILGLLSTESVSAERFTNIRRKVFYFYPNGAAPLTGLLSLMKDEDTNDPEFSWYEKRMKTQTTTSISRGSSKGPFTVSDGSGDSDPITLTVDVVYRWHVTDPTIFRVGHVVKMPVTTGSTTLTDAKGVVTEVHDEASPKYIKVRMLATLATIDNGTTNENVGREVWIIGSAFSQGAVDTSSDIYNLPTSIGNYTQIFRSPFRLTGTALKTEVKFDASGPYKDKAKETSVDHMIEMEKAFIFGKKNKFVDADGLPVYTTNGVIEFLKLWEAGATYGNSAATVDTDDNKRIIINSSGTMNHKLYNKYLERLFRVTNNTANEKLFLCGSGFLSVINQMYEGRITLQGSLPFKNGFGVDISRHDTPYGSVFYKSHPLFSQNPTLRYNALAVDVPNLKYRYVSGRDTELLVNRQPNDADYRKDEWLSECGLEVHFPESFMYIQNVQDFVP